MVKKSSKSVVVVAALALFAWVVIGDLFTSSSNGVVRASAPSKSTMKYSGASVYKKYCARCHGADGRSKTRKGKKTRSTDLTKSRMRTAAGIKIISKGKELMPGFKDSISPKDMRIVMNYVKRFRK